jgi:hypothetical protein
MIPSTSQPPAGVLAHVVDRTTQEHRSLGLIPRSSTAANDWEAVAWGGARATHYADQAAAVEGAKALFAGFDPMRMNLDTTFDAAAVLHEGGGFRVTPVRTRDSLIAGVEPSTQYGASAKGTYAESVTVTPSDPALAAMVGMDGTVYDFTASGGGPVTWTESKAPLQAPVRSIS